MLHWLQRPVVGLDGRRRTCCGFAGRHFRALVDPTHQDLDIFFRDSSPTGRHLQVFICFLDDRNQPTFTGVAGHHKRLTIIATLQKGLALVNTKMAIRFFGSVTGETVLGKDRSNLLFKIDLFPSRLFLWRRCLSGQFACQSKKQQPNSYIGHPVYRLISHETLSLGASHGVQRFLFSVINACGTATQKTRSSFDHYSSRIQRAVSFGYANLCSEVCPIVWKSCFLDRCRAPIRLILTLILVICWLDNGASFLVLCASGQDRAARILSCN